MLHNCRQESAGEEAPKKLTRQELRAQVKLEHCGVLACDLIMQYCRQQETLKGIPDLVAMAAAHHGGCLAKESSTVVCSLEAKACTPAASSNPVNVVL
jgi:hypothetical protein